MELSESRSLDRAWNCRLTTTGRKSGQPRRVTIWFVLDGEELYLTGGAENPHWCRNAAANPDVEVEISGRRLVGKASVLPEGPEAEAVRLRFTQKYFLARVARWLGRGYTDSTAVVVRL